MRARRHLVKGAEFIGRETVGPLRRVAPASSRSNDDPTPEGPTDQRTCTTPASIKSLVVGAAFVAGAVPTTPDGSTGP